MNAFVNTVYIGGVTALNFLKLVRHYLTMHHFLNSCDTTMTHVMLNNRVGAPKLLEVVVFCNVKKLV